MSSPTSSRRMDVSSSGTPNGNAVAASRRTALLRKPLGARVQVVLAAVPAAGRDEVAAVSCRVGRVGRELLAHHRARARIGEPEVDTNGDTALEGVTVGEPFVRDAAQVPGLVCE